MPLNCDCYGGCWGAHSKNWPSILIPKKMIAGSESRYPESGLMQRLLQKLSEPIPYGSYVIADGDFRFETTEYRDRALDGLNLLLIDDGKQFDPC